MPAGAESEYCRVTEANEIDKASATYNDIKQNEHAVKTKPREGPVMFNAKRQVVRTAKACIARTPLCCAGVIRGIEGGRDL